MAGRANRFTIYDALEKSGYFDSNPANAFSQSPVDQSSLYKGPVEFPKMLYHPLGEEKITVPGEVLSTPSGPKLVGEQREMLTIIVNNLAEGSAAAAEGWHDHPAKAMKARVEAWISASPDMTDLQKDKLLKSVPAITSNDRIRQLEMELARLTKLKDETNTSVAAE